ncbi:phloem protein 2-B15, partial [Striga asiatica]
WTNGLGVAYEEHPSPQILVREVTVSWHLDGAVEFLQLLILELKMRNIWIIAASHVVSFTCPRDACCSSARKIRHSDAFPKHNFGAYLVFQLTGRDFGLSSSPLEVSVEIGDRKKTGRFYLKQDECKGQEESDVASRALSPRGDGWS